MKSIPISDENLKLISDNCGVTIKEQIEKDVKANGVSEKGWHYYVTYLVLRKEKQDPKFFFCKFIVTTNTEEDCNCGQCPEGTKKTGWQLHSGAEIDQETYLKYNPAMKIENN